MGYLGLHGKMYDWLCTNTYPLPNSIQSHFFPPRCYIHPYIWRFSPNVSSTEWCPSMSSKTFIEPESIFTQEREFGRSPYGTAKSLKPLTYFELYQNGQICNITKSIYQLFHNDFIVCISVHVQNQNQFYISKQIGHSHCLNFNWFIDC